MAIPTLPQTYRLKPEDAAKYLGVSKRTLEVWRAKGTGPEYFRFGRQIRYAITELDAYRNSRTAQ